MTVLDGLREFITSNFAPVATIAVAVVTGIFALIAAREPRSARLEKLANAYKALHDSGNEAAAAKVDVIIMTEVARGRSNYFFPYQKAIGWVSIVDSVVLLICAVYSLGGTGAWYLVVRTVVYFGFAIVAMLVGVIALIDAKNYEQ
ncbi:hypothetical protein I6E06_08340 [Bifidobacterium boum]|uniref:hypothetical protein n=1 Tax=Bifidobacterium boum TaxID=78343 RepID=UPI001F35C822|nr:hypothetical protein [Bifidobacterium boum]MCF2562454.1 hypothetical protein [Bifidobacterium boum]